MHRHDFKVIIVTGVPGVGKTTVLSYLANILGSKNTPYLITNFGDYMFQAALKKGYVKNRDEIRKLEQRIQLGLQELASKLIIEEARKKLPQNGVLIVDTHSIIKTRTGLWPGLPEDVVKTLLPDAIILIEAKPEQILERQRKDKTRYREDVSNIDFLKEFMSQARTAAIASAVHTASAVVIIENPEGKPDKAAYDIFEIIKTV